MAARSGRDMFTNPAVSRVRNFDDAFSGFETATYGGVLAKTLYFLATILLGIGAFFYIHNYYAAEHFTAAVIADGYVIYANEAAILTGVMIATLVCAIISGFVPAAIPVAGTVYCAGMGYAATFISYTYAAVYKGIIIEALLLTILVIAVMAVLYTTKLVKVGEGFKTVVYTTLLVSFIGGCIFSLMLWLAPNSTLVTSILRLQNGPLGIFMAVVGVLLGAALILCDFETISETVEHGLSKKYEWYCSFSLMTSVIYLYLKVLQLLVRINNNRN